MERKRIFLMVLAAILLGSFLAFSNSIKDTALIWYETRIFGLISFIALFATVILGEIRLLHKTKGEFELFRFHKPIAIFAVTTVFLHMASAMMDKFKWGKTISLVQFLGFSFSDKWLIFLSFGTLAFYLMIIISMTSMQKGMQFFGFKKWKLVHFLSYAAFIIAYIHSVNLGTDLKTGELQYILMPIFLICFWTTISLVLARITSSFIAFEDQKEYNLLASFFILLVVGLVLSAKFMVAATQETESLQSQVYESRMAVSAYSEEVEKLSRETALIQIELEVIKDG